MKSLLLASSLLVSTSLTASPSIPHDQQIASFTVEEVIDSKNKSIESNPRNIKVPQRHTGRDQNPNDPAPNYQDPNYQDPNYSGSTSPDKPDKFETAGKVIQVARDLVALGEAAYSLVQKGKPTNVTEYAPISVVPRDPLSKEFVDPFELEGFSMPVEKNYVAKVKNGSGKEVVTFSYKVIYSYGGSYNGAGKYLTNVIIIPGSIRTSFGWDFNATMKLSGIMNHGTKEEPVAGVMVTVKYQMNSWASAFERNDTIHITGNGELKGFHSN